MEEEKKEIKEEVKEEGAIGETQTPNEVPTVNTEPEVTEEQKAEANLTEDNPDGTPTPNPQVTHTPVEGQSEVHSEGSGNVEEQIEKMLTQSQVNELIGNTRTETRDKTRAEVLNEIYGRYGVSGDDELNDIFGKGQAYDVMNDDNITLSNQLREALAENALLKAGISESRWGDARAILTSKGLEVNQDNILSELQTHPEWKAIPNVVSDGAKVLTPQGAEQMVQGARTSVPDPTPPSVIRRLGENGEGIQSSESEDARMKKLFNL